MNRILLSLAFAGVAAIATGCGAPPPRTNPEYDNGNRVNPQPQPQPQPQPGPVNVDIPTMASIDGEVQALNTTTHRARIIARAGSVADAEAAAKLEAAKASIKSAVNASAWSDAQWPSQANGHTTIESGGRKQLRLPEGGWELQVNVTVRSAALLEWAKDAGYMARTDTPADTVPPPEIFILPAQQAGKWPETLTDDESLVYATIQNYLKEPPREIQTVDYETYYNAYVNELADSTGVVEGDQNYLIGGDIYIQYNIKVEAGTMPGTIKARVDIKGVLTTTAFVAFNDYRFSKEVAASQRTAAIIQAAQDAAGACFTKLMADYEQTYRKGVPYRIILSGIEDDPDILRNYQKVLVAVSTPNMRPNIKTKNGTMEATVYAKTNLADPIEFMGSINDGLKEYGLRMKVQNRSRFFWGQLIPR